jgi:CRP-like cAMP-binding protein
MRDRRAVETSTIGSESAPAILAALTGGASAARVFIQVAGSVIRLPVTGLRQAAFARPEVMLTLLQFAQRDAYVSDLSVACNALHNVPARLARWLLLTQDRVGGAVIPLTQDHLSIMLGVQRTTVTGAAQSLKRDGLIRYSRGQITIVDRLGLIEAACECYGEQTRRYAS